MRIVVHAAVLAAIDLVAIRLGHALYRVSSMEDPLTVQLPVAVALTVVAFALWAQTVSGNGRRPAWAPRPRTRAVAIWVLALGLGPVLTALVQGFVFSDPTSLWVFQAPANALALGAGALLSRPTDPAPAHLFVYGLLRSDGPEHGRLAGRGRSLGEAFMRGRVYEVDGYPAAVPSEDADDRVWGELFALSDAEHLLGELDAYEQVDDRPGETREYLRVLADAHVFGRDPIKAWAYVYARPVEGLTRVEDGRWRVRPDAGREGGGVRA